LRSCFPKSTKSSKTAPELPRTSIFARRPGAPETAGDELSQIDAEIEEMKAWMQSRGSEITRLYSARQVVEQRGTIRKDYTVARDRGGTVLPPVARPVRKRHVDHHLWSVFARPGRRDEAHAASKASTSAAGRLGQGFDHEDPGPDLASYPLSQVPDEAAPIVRALLPPTRTSSIACSMIRRGRADTPFVTITAVHHRRRRHRPRRRTPRAQPGSPLRGSRRAGLPHRGPEARREEVRSPGRQGPGARWTSRSSASTPRASSSTSWACPASSWRAPTPKPRPTSTARRRARSAFILGATNRNLPSFKITYISILKRFYESGVEEINGHKLFNISGRAYDEAYAWLKQVGVMDVIDEHIADYQSGASPSIDKTVDEVTIKFLDTWQMEAGLKTFPQAVADVMKFESDEGAEFDLTVDEWLEWAYGVSYAEARDKAKSLGISIIWDCERARTPEGYYQIQGGIEYAISKSLAVAPFCDIIWMETKTADLADAVEFRRSDSRRSSRTRCWRTTCRRRSTGTRPACRRRNAPVPGRARQAGIRLQLHHLRRPPGRRLGGRGIRDGCSKKTACWRWRACSASCACSNSPYKTPQTLRRRTALDGALMASTGRTATTKAMGKGSTQFQHLVQTEVPPKLLEDWLDKWSAHYKIGGKLRVKLRPHTAGAELLDLNVYDESGEKLADVVFATIQDRRDRCILSVRDQNTYKMDFRQKRLMTLLHLFLVHRYKAVWVHYVSPTDDNEKQAKRMQAMSIYSEVNTEIGHIIVATVNTATLKELLDPKADHLTVCGPTIAPWRQMAPITSSTEWSGPSRSFSAMKASK
jgi:isocitrate lyase